MSCDFVNIERTNNHKPICVTDESLQREFFYDIDSHIPFWKVRTPMPCMVGNLYDFTWVLNEDDCSCEGCTITCLVVKTEPDNIHYLVEYCNNEIFKTRTDKGYDLYNKCHAKDILGFDLNTIEYNPESETDTIQTLKYKVIDEDGHDITDEETWVLLPNGELMFLDYGDLTGYPSARVVPLNE